MDNTWVKHLNPFAAIRQIEDMKGFYQQKLLIEEDVGKLAIYRLYFKACENAVALCKLAGERGETIDVDDLEAMFVPSSDGAPYRTSKSTCMCKGGMRPICKHRIVVQAAREIIYGESNRVDL